MPNHPGGGELIGEHLGKNIVEEFEDAEHTKYAKLLLLGLPKVGTIIKEVNGPSEETQDSSR